MSKRETEKIYKLIFDSKKDDCRLDQFLAGHAQLKNSELSRSQLKQIIAAGNVSVNEKAVFKAGFALSPGDKVEIRLKAPEENTQQAYDFILNVVYEDKDLIVINKPAGLTVHPGVGTGSETLLNALISYYRKKSKKLPAVFSAVAESRGGIVHRLDKDTTGIMVVAKTLGSLQSLAAQFADRSIGRYYQALVFSTPRANRIINKSDSGTIDLPIGRDPKRRISMAVAGLANRHAVTTWTVIERLNYATLLELKLGTGRTHQIRVHMNAIGSPVIGDRTYGDFSGLPQSLKKIGLEFGRQALHAKTLAFNHPVSGERLSFDSDLPVDMLELIEKFRLSLPNI